MLYIRRHGLVYSWVTCGLLLSHISYVFGTTAGNHTINNGSVSHSSSTTTRNNTTSIAQQKFSMVLRRDRSDGSSVNNTVIERGIIGTRFSQQCNDSLVMGCSLHVFNAFEDQISFEFSYVDGRHMALKPPSIRAYGGRAQPKVDEYSNDMDEKSGEIVASHFCKRASQPEMSTSVVVLSLELAPGVVVKVFWEKICGYGENKYIDFGYIEDELDDRYREVSIQNEPENGDVTTVGPSVVTTRLYMTLTKEGGSQRFERPLYKLTAISDAAKRGKPLGIQIKGGSYGGVINWKLFSMLDVFYTCEGHGLWRIQVRIKVDPYKEISWKWTKDCGGGVERRLSVGTTNEYEIGDVVKGGRTMGGYTLHSKNRGLSGLGSGLKVFFLKVSGGREFGNIRIGAITAQSLQPHIGSAGIAQATEMVQKAGNVGVFGENGGEMGGRSKRIIGIRVRCVRRGRMKVEVGVMIQDREAVEWWFYNECKQGEVGHRGERGVFGRPTAAMAMYLSLMVFGVVSVVYLRAGCGGDWGRGQKKKGSEKSVYRKMQRVSLQMH